MSKKLLIGLVPMLATVAVVAMPMAAQAATPHYYADGVKDTEGQKLPSISWGDLTLGSSNPAIKPLSCENAVLGWGENPTTTGAGVGQTTNFATSSCFDEECPESSGVELQVHSQALPWPSILVGETTGSDQVETKEANVLVGCYLKTVNGKFGTELAAAATTCTGSSNPKFINGEGSLSQTASRVQFTGMSEELVCLTSGVETKGKTSKTLKTMNYGEVPPGGPFTSNTAQQTVEIKNP